jgi:hypothetical protein
MLTISEQRYQEIRREVMRRRLEAKIEKIMAEQCSMTFTNIDAFLNHLDEQPVDRPARSSRKRP